MAAANSLLEWTVRGCGDGDRLTACEIGDEAKPKPEFDSFVKPDFGLSDPNGTSKWVAPIGLPTIEAFERVPTFEMNEEPAAAAVAVAGDKDEAETDAAAAAVRVGIGLATDNRDPPPEGCISLSAALMMLGKSERPLLRELR